MSSTAESTTRTLLVERVFPYPPEKLWRALTENPLIAQWLMKNDFEPVLGRKFRFRSEPRPNWDGVIDCEVLIVDHLKRLAYSWSSMGLDFVVLWTLTPADGGTHLSMEQSGFRADQPANYQGAKYGWQRFFDGLEQMLGVRVNEDGPCGTSSSVG
jgi:uncharacterized protein YndB with AHSA1/START domain